MAVDERARIQLQKSLEQTLGADSAVTLMTLLPPVGWADVATSRDVDGVRQELRALEGRIEDRFAVQDARTDARFAQFDARFDAADARFDALDQRLDDRFEATERRLEALFRRELVAAVAGQTRTMVAGLMGTALTVGGLALAFARWL